MISGHRASFQIHEIAGAGGGELIKEGIAAVLEFELEFGRVEGNDRPEMDRGAIDEIEGFEAITADPGRAEDDAGEGAAGGERGGWVTVGDTMTVAEPGLVFVRQAGELLQPADGPVVGLVFEGLLIEWPIGRDADHEFGEFPLLHAFRNGHREITHAAGDERNPWSFRRGGNDVDIDMNGGGNQFVEDRGRFSEVVGDVFFDRFKIVGMRSDDGRGLGRGAVADVLLLLAGLLENGESERDVQDVSVRFLGGHADDVGGVDVLGVKTAAIEHGIEEDE